MRGKLKFAGLGVLALVVIVLIAGYAALRSSGQPQVEGSRFRYQLANSAAENRMLGSLGREHPELATMQNFANVG